MDSTWKLQDAKAKFSQLVEDALNKGPQYVTRRGRNAVVVISADKYSQLVSPKPDFRKFLLDCPKIDDDIIFDRQKDEPRRIDL